MDGELTGAKISQYYECVWCVQGSGVIKAGFAGEEYPKFHFPS